MHTLGARDELDALGSGRELADLTEHPCSEPEVGAVREHAVDRFGSDDEAIERANDTRYGLNASVWSRSVQRGHEVASRLRAGTVNVNEAYAAAWGSIDAPMGGMGDSGLGRRHGKEGILKYTESQTIARQRLMNLAPPLTQLGDKGFADVMTTALRLMKKVGWR